MDSWTLQGDSYSFLRSAPLTFSLRHRDGTPNHVEIFDITNIPSHRSAISETTCLCDIFSDDCETASLSSSPASGSVAPPPQREATRRPLPSPVDEANDSSGSYHTASSSEQLSDVEVSEGSFEKPGSPASLEKPENRQLEPSGVSATSPSGQLCLEAPLQIQDCRQTPEPKSVHLLAPGLRTGDREVERCTSVDRTPSPRYTTSSTPTSDGRGSACSGGSSSASSRGPVSSPLPRDSRLSPRPRSLTPRDGGSDPSPSPRPSGLTPSPEPLSYRRNPSPLSSPGVEASSPQPTSTSSSSEPWVPSTSADITPTPSPVFSCTDIPSPSRETSVSPQLRGGAHSPDAQASSSPFPERRGRVSLPDLFSRGSTPDIEDSASTPELIPHISPSITPTPGNADSRLSSCPGSPISTPGPGYTPPPSVTSPATTPDLGGQPCVYRGTGSSPDLLPTPSPSEAWGRTPSPEVRCDSSTCPEIPCASSPEITYTRALSPGPRYNSSPVESRNTAPSPEIRVTASSPEVRRRDPSPGVPGNPLFNSLQPHLHSSSPNPRSLASSPQITGFSYSILPPEPQDTPSLERNALTASPEPRGTHLSAGGAGPHLSPGSRSTTPPIVSRRLSAASIGTAPSPDPRGSPQTTGVLCSVLTPQGRETETSSGHRDESPCFPIQSTKVSFSSEVSETQYRVCSEAEIPEVSSPEPDTTAVSPAVPSHIHTPELRASPLAIVTRATGRSPEHSNFQELPPKGIQHPSNHMEACPLDEDKELSLPSVQRTQGQSSWSPDVQKPLAILRHPSPTLSPGLKGTPTSPAPRPEDLKSPHSSISPPLDPHNQHSPQFIPPARQTPPKPRADFRERPSVMAQNRNRRRTPSPPLTRFTPVHIIPPDKPQRQWQNRGHSPPRPQVTQSPPRGHKKPALKPVTSRGSPNVSPGDRSGSHSQLHWDKLERESERVRMREGDNQRERVRQEERQREEQAPGKGEGRPGEASYRGEQVELSFSARNRKGPASHSATPTSRPTRQGMPAARCHTESLLASRQQQRSLLRAHSSQANTRGGGPTRRFQPAVPQKGSSAPGRAIAEGHCPGSNPSMGSELDEADNEVKWFTDVAFRSLSSPEGDYLDMYNSSHRSSTNVSQPSTQDSPAAANAAGLAYADLRGSAPRLENEDFPSQPPHLFHYPDGLDPAKHYEMGSFECVDVAVEREEVRRGRRGVPKRQIQLKRRDTEERKQGEGSESDSPGVPGMMGSPTLQRRSKETLVRQHSTPAALEDSYHPEPSPEPADRRVRKSKLQKSVSLDETCTKTKMATCLIKSVLSKKMQSVGKQSNQQEGEDSCPPEDKTLPFESVVSPVEESSKPKAHHFSSSFQSEHSLSPEDMSVNRGASPKSDTSQQKGFGVKPSVRISPHIPTVSHSTIRPSSNEGADSQNRKPNPESSKIRSEPLVPLNENSPTRDKHYPRTGDRQTGDENKIEEKEGDDSAENVAAGNTGAGGTQEGMTNREKESRSIDSGSYTPPSMKSTYMSRTPEITLKPRSSTEKKKSSINVSLMPDLDAKPDPRRESPSPSNPGKTESEEARLGARDEEKAEDAEANGDGRARAPMHRVRDVRRMVKNTYNLSFKPTSATLPTHEREVTRGERREEERREERREEERREERREKERREEERRERHEDTREEARVERKLQPVTPTPQRRAKPLPRPQLMQIECKAVSWRENKDTTTSGKSAAGGKLPDEASSSPPQLSLPRPKEPGNSPDVTPRSYTTEDVAGTESCQTAAPVDSVGTETTTCSASDERREVMRRDSKPPMLGSIPRAPSKDREVSSATMVLHDGTSKVKPPQAQSPGSTTSQPPALTPTQAAVSTPTLPTSPSPGPISNPAPGSSSSHSVSMLVREKGYQADIGAVVSEGPTEAGGGVRGGVPRKHVNRLEIPLQTSGPADRPAGPSHGQRERTLSSSSSSVSAPASSSLPGLRSGPTAPPTDKEERFGGKATGRDTPQGTPPPPQRNTQQQTPSPLKQTEVEAVKKQGPPVSPKSPATRRFRPQAIEVRSMSKDTHKQETVVNTSPSNRPQAIEVRSIANNSQKPTVPPKPSYRFKPADGRSLSNESQMTSEWIMAQQKEEERTVIDSTQTQAATPPSPHRHPSNDNAPANYTRKLAVSAVSSYKPPQSKTSTTMSSFSNRAASAETEVSTDAARQPGTSTQTSGIAQRPPTLNPVPAQPPSDPQPPASSLASQPSQPAVVDLRSHPQYPKTTYPREQAVPGTFHNTKQAAMVSTSQAPGYSHQPLHRSLSNERSYRTDDLCFYASDDPPSYDERESFSPLLLPDLTSRKLSRYHPSSRPPPCSCTSGCPSHPGLTPPHHHHSPHSLTPPAPSHSPGQSLTYPMAQPPLRHLPHQQCRPEPQALSYQPSSPKSTHAPAMYQPIHQPPGPACPPHPSMLHPCPGDRPLQPPQHMDPRRPPVHRSPQQQQGGGGGSYSDHSHSPNLPPMDAGPQYLCGPQSLGPSYGSEYGGDGSSLYPDSGGGLGYGQTPRRVLMDPETGKYFYIEVPVQPLRKMLFDPETGQYVEVLIPQQAMSHSSIYPPSAAPYSSLHNPNMYAPAPQYLPYAVPPPPPHPQAQPQPPRHPEAPAPGTMHHNGAGVAYGSPSGQGSKPEAQSHPLLEQSYLESMYYVPTGMTASPNPTPPDCYHKHPSSLPNTGGKRS
ncbi:serine/arginine repetitive matrix protein 2 [Hypomesus transpacificus]|uniref:serine/arginine repetitive matrix protein 2 n=1 Tax=Hypomesus transpacificus TaxID=137520 RepID=UPI001F071B41|nr:serine/arginine repetitive matrix protein 2 [Hypomesus transpacificus]